MSANPGLLVWCDLETTGLDPSTCFILEAAISIAPFSEPFHLGSMYSRVLYGHRVNDAADEFVREMHTKNGLWDECEKSHINSAIVDVQISRLITDALNKVGGSEKPVLAGSTVHFDLAFIRRWLPMTAALLSHRVYDVSGIKLFCQSLGMEPIPRESEPAHRAKDDILVSVEHAELCVKWLSRFVSPHPTMAGQHAAGFQGGW